MARPQETPIFPSTYDSGSEDYDDTAAASGCGCFRRFCFRRRDYESRSYLLHEKEAQHQRWFKKLKEFSELVAGPKWKNLIRKIGRNCKSRKQNKTADHLQYSPESYALNFAGADTELLHSFSSRYAPGYFINDQQRGSVL